MFAKTVDTSRSCQDRIASVTLTIVAELVRRAVIRVLLPAIGAKPIKVRMAVITIAILVSLRAALLARISGIIAIIAHTVDAATVGQIGAAYAALGSILILAAEAEALKAVIPISLSACSAHAYGAIAFTPAGLTNTADQWIRISVGNAANIAGGEIALILVVIRLSAATFAVSTLYLARGYASAAKRADD